MAFQIADDLLDYTEDEAVTGKPSGLDLREHKVTLPLIAALPADERGGARRVVAQLMQRRAADRRADRAGRRAGGAAGGLEYARERAQRLAQQAEAELDGCPPSPAREALRASITYVLERRR